MTTNFRTYTPFFDYFPKVKYDINRSQYPNYDTVTNIMFRMAILKNILSNTSSYYAYDIEADDTPEIVAEKIYGDPGANWIVIYANQIVDPQFDWAMNDDVFKKYLINKYGSVENAQTTVHHYEKVIETTVNGETSTAIYQIDRRRLTENELTVPDSTFDDYVNNFTIDTEMYTVDSTSLSADMTVYFDSNDWELINTQVNKLFKTYTLGDQTVDEVTYSQAITNYEYEVQINDSRRQIKVIKAAYYDQIIREFREMVGNVPAYIRTVA